jgi:hypothetical protein
VVATPETILDIRDAWLEDEAEVATQKVTIVYVQKERNDELRKHPADE